MKYNYHSVQLLSCVRLFAIPWTAACQASLSITDSQSLLKLMSIELVMPSNHFTFNLIIKDSKSNNKYEPSTFAVLGTLYSFQLILKTTQ